MGEPYTVATKLAVLSKVPPITTTLIAALVHFVAAPPNARAARGRSQKATSTSCQSGVLLSHAFAVSNPTWAAKDIKLAHKNMNLHTAGRFGSSLAEAVAVKIAKAAAKRAATCSVARARAPTKWRLAGSHQGDGLGVSTPLAGTRCRLYDFGAVLTNP